MDSRNSLRELRYCERNREANECMLIMAFAAT